MHPDRGGTVRNAGCGRERVGIVEEKRIVCGASAALFARMSYVGYRSWGFSGEGGS